MKAAFVAEWLHNLRGSQKNFPQPRESKKRISAYFKLVNRKSSTSQETKKQTIQSKLSNLQEACSRLINRVLTDFRFHLKAQPENKKS